MLEFVEEYIINNWAKISPDIALNSSFTVSTSKGDSITGPPYKMVVTQSPTPQGTKKRAGAISDDALKQSNETISICVYSDSQAVAWIKLSNNTECHGLLQQEYQNLRYVHGSLNPDDRKSIPTPLALETVDGFCFFVQSFIEGKVMSADISPFLFLSKRKLNQKLSAIKAWLLEFQSQTVKGNAVPVKHYTEQNFVAPFERLRADSGLSSSDMKFLHKYQRSIESIGECETSIVAAHGDFWACNIMFDRDDSVHVVDWCDLEQDSNPFLDIFTLVSTFRFPGRNTEENILRSLEYCFLKKNWFSRLLKENVRNFCHALNYDFQVVKIFYPVFLMNRITRANMLGDLIERPHWRQYLDLYIENEANFWN